MAKFWFDVARDKDSNKVSTTKVIGLAGSMMVFILFGLSMFIMWAKQETDHILVGEMMGFVLTLLGFKNKFGFNKSTKTDVNSMTEPLIESESQKDEGVF